MLRRPLERSLARGMTFALGGVLDAKSIQCLEGARRHVRRALVGNHLRPCLAREALAHELRDHLGGLRWSDQHAIEQIRVPSADVLHGDELELDPEHGDAGGVRRFHGVRQDDVEAEAPATLLTFGLGLWLGRWRSSRQRPVAPGSVQPASQRAHGQRHGLAESLLADAQAVAQPLVRANDVLARLSATELDRGKHRGGDCEQGRDPARARA